MMLHAPDARYIVVRRPEFSEESTMLPLGRIYQGIDRDAWFDVFDENYYSKKMPDQILSISTKIKNSGNELFGLTVASLADAQNLLQWSNRDKPQNEIVSVMHADDAAASETRFLGYDVFSKGEWSLCFALLVKSLSAGTSLAKITNASGLCNRLEDCDSIVEDYEKAIASGLVEPTQDLNATTIRFLAVSRV